MFGSNLVSSWRDETEEEEQRARYDALGLGDYEHIDDDWHPATQAAYDASHYADPDFTGETVGMPGVEPS